MIFLLPLLVRIKLIMYDIGNITINSVTQTMVHWILSESFYVCTLFVLKYTQSVCYLLYINNVDLLVEKFNAS